LNACQNRPVPAPSGEPDRNLPSISVVICAYEAERLGALGEALDSVRSQTVPADEIVLVIDYADDLLAECRARWPDVVAVPNEGSVGASGARNTGLRLCKGEIVACLDDDAVASPDWLERLARTYADRAVLGAGGGVRPRWARGRPRWFPAEFDWVVGCSHSGMPRTRATVRNLVGANMSFRRDVLLELGGFREELGRIRKVPVGCEETDFCIRATERWPEGLIVYDPAADVEHAVPAERGRLRYFLGRCWSEGLSKALLTRLVGSDSSLSAERSYVRRTLPLGFARGIAAALRGDLAGAARAAMIAVGLLATSAGYARGLDPLRSLPRARREKGEEGGPLQVLMVTPRTPLRQGGVERHVREVSRRLVAAGAGVDVLCTEPGGPPLTVEERDRVEIRSVRSWPAESDLYLAPRIWREMARKPWGIVHVQSYHTLVAPLAMLRALTLGIPYVLTFHGGGHSSKVRHRLRVVQRRALRPLLARAECLIAVARFEVELYSRELRLPREKFVLIPNGTDIAEAEPVDGRDPEPGVLASIGRLERYKGHHRVIEALPRVLERQPDARLLVVGTGPYEPALRRRAAELGVEDRVEFTSVPADDRSGMTELLRRVSLVVLLSEFETHPLVALEAAATRTPLLVANGSGLGELAEDGLARAVAPDETETAVADAIVEELRNPSERRKLELTSWDECANSLLELYRSLV
jgi:glycosyltransferase involved in cell wall biosynthesis/GT2 family glycosyltransferase